MLIWGLLFHAMISWSKDVRTLAFTNEEVRVCGQKVSWVHLIPELTPAEVECLDSNQPLEEKNLIETASDPVKQKSINSVFSLSRNKIVSLLKSVKHTCLEQVEIKIPEKIQMNWVRQLNNLFFQSWLEIELKKNNTDKTVKIVQVTLPKIECSQVQAVEWGSLRVESKNTFRFLLVADDKNFGVSGEFRTFQKLPVAKRNINFMEKVSESDFETQEKDVTFSPGYVAEIKDMLGRTLSSSVAQGSAVELKALKPEFQVEKGQIVQIQFQGQNFEVSANGIAEQNGAVGDLIKIKNTETQKILSGVVTGKGFVEVK